MSGIYQLNQATGSVTLPSSGNTFIGTSTNSELYSVDSSGTVTVYGTGSGGGGSTIDTGSFATTGSNNFIGNQSVTGIITTTGNISSSGTVIAGNLNIDGSITGSSAILNALPTIEPSTTGSLWISGSSVAHPNSGYLMVFNP